MSYITFVVNNPSKNQQKLKGMTSLYRAIQTLGWAPKQYVLLVATLLLLAAAPVLLAIQDHNFEIDEHASAGTVVGAISPATDGEGDPLDFLILDGNTDGTFALGAETGILTVANAAALDYEINPLYTLTVQVTADKGEPTEEVTEITVTVALNDLVEAPTASTGAATDVLENAATLHGTAQSNGAATTVAFQWSQSPSMSSVDPATLPGAKTLSAGAPATNLSYDISELSAGTIYYYRLVAKNSAGTTYGETKSFTTHTIPNVVSILRNGSSPTKASSLVFVVTFSEAVSGVDAGDFVLGKNGTITGSISAVEVVSVEEYHVTVSGITGNGFM
ncbi:MAG: cadherin repeat domain-containing protein, partial [Bacteroidetes bacterium]|nr:cadherin repeat domain-containing protein [Bacteroidota bacterium]